MQAVINHITKNIENENIKSKKLIFGSSKKERSTNEVNPWSTTKGVIDNIKKSHTSPSPYDNKWEKEASVEFERNDRVESWVKNDRIGFAITYQYEGHIMEYYPDFLVRLGNKEKRFIMLVLEVKGQKSSQSDVKHEGLAEWVKAVNADGRSGTWAYGVSDDPGDVNRIIKQYYPA